jgi:polysaccharide deacetylase
MTARPVATPTLLFFWDYDTQWGGDRSRSPGGAKQWGHAEFENTERLLELHARYGVPACFAVVGAAALPGSRPYHDPAQIRSIHAAGHEVASHSFRHEWLPGIGYRGLLETLRLSKQALEQCIGAPVTSFVPPYNQPFDYARRWSISLSERWRVNGDRIDVPALCTALQETGYRFCRVSYRPLALRVADHLVGGRLDRPVRQERIAGVTCVRFNSPGGFAARTMAVVERCVRLGGIVVVCGHPHSLHAANTQAERCLRPFLSRIQGLQAGGHLRACLPRDLEWTD